MHPPLQELFAAFVGYTPAPDTKNAEAADDSEQLIKDLVAAGFSFPPELLG